MTPPDQSTAAVAEPPPRPASGPQRADVEVVEYDRYIDERIRRTRRMVKVMDVAHALMLLAAGWIVLLVGAAVVEHWFVPGGLTVSGRYAVFGAAITASVGLLAARLLPIVTRRVNPLYAAEAIERTTPSLKNTLVNLLLLRGDAGGRQPAALREELEREAAERIVGADSDAAIDRGGVIRLGYVVIGLMVAMVGYALLSPKNPFATAARVLAPWADIAAPTRVRILDLSPGDAEFAQGEFATVTARITGLEADEQAWLVTSTADRQQRERRVAIPSSDGVNRFEARLPAGGELGLQQDVAYRIEAGDARTPPFRLRVVKAPTIVVRSVHYDYPDYTGYLDRESPNTGDLRAIEGTRVRIDAVANLPIDLAQVDLGADGRPDLRMRVDDQAATAEFTLSLRDDRRTPMHPSYVLRLATIDGRANNDPATHRIEVLPDLPPEVEIVEPSQSVCDLQLNETATIRIRARDPDFGLATVRLAATRLAGETDFSSRDLLDRGLLRTPIEGRFDGLYRFKPSEHGLKAGDVVEYRVVATDVRQPNPNQATTAAKRFRIVGIKDEQRRERKEQGEAGDNREPSQGENDQGEQDQGQQDQGGAAGEEETGGGESQTGNPEQQPQDGSSGEGSQGESASDGQSSQGQEGKPREQESSDGGSSDGANGVQGRETDGGENASEGGNSGSGSNPSQADRQSDPTGNGGGDASTPDKATGQRSPSQSEPGNAGDRQPNAQSPTNNEPSGGQPDEQPVASDGENDGEAFDRIKEFLDQEGKRSESEKPQPSDGGGERADPSNGESSQGEGNDPSSDAEGGEPEGDASDRQPDDSGQDGAGEAPTSPNSSQRESDATGGDESQSEGGGEKGQGKQSPRDGTGSAGETNAADDGQGRAADRGAGEETSAAGDRKPSDQPTGNPADGERGDGSTQAESSEGESSEGQSSNGQSGDEPSDGESGGEGSDSQSGSSDTGQSSEGEMGDAGDRQGRPEGSPSDKGKGEQGNNESHGEASPEGGEPSRSGEPGEASNDQGDAESAAETEGMASEGNPQDGSNNEQRGESAERGDEAGKGSTPGGGQQARPSAEDAATSPGADDANLDYARKQTDLILDELDERLRDKNVDRELLDKLGWTEDDLRRFVDRWQARKQRARLNPGERSELDQDLRSLGLKPPALDGNVGRAADNLRVGSGYRSEAPAAVRERLKAYNTGVSRAADDR